MRDVYLLREGEITAVDNCTVNIGPDMLRELHEFSAEVAIGCCQVTAVQQW